VFFFSVYWIANFCLRRIIGRFSSAARQQRQGFQFPAPDPWKYAPAHYECSVRGSQKHFSHDSRRCKYFRNSVFLRSCSLFLLPFFAVLMCLELIGV